MTAEQLKARTTPPPRTSDDLLKLADEQLIKAEEETDPEADGSTKEDREYRFFFKGPTKALSGWFTHRVPSIHDRQRIAIILSNVQGGQPWSSFPPDVRLSNRALAYCSVCMIKRPDWADNLQELVDARVVVGLWEEGVAHGATFLGPGQDPGAGASGEG